MIFILCDFLRTKTLSDLDIDRVKQIVEALKHCIVETAQLKEICSIVLETLEKIFIPSLELPLGADNHLISCTI